MATIHLEEFAQIRAGIAAANAVGAEGDKATGNVAANLVWETAHIVAGCNHRPRALLQALCHERHAWRGFRMHAVPAFAGHAVAAQFRETGGAPHVAGDAEILRQQFRRRDHFTQNGPAAH